MTEITIVVLGLVIYIWAGSFTASFIKRWVKKSKIVDESEAFTFALLGGMLWPAAILAALIYLLNRQTDRILKYLLRKKGEDE